MYGANVYVVDEHRRNGVARQLMLALIEFAEANAMVRLVLAPSEMSVPLYTSLGFRTAHDLMRLDLDTSAQPMCVARISACGVFGYVSRAQPWTRRAMRQACTIVVTDGIAG